MADVFISYSRKNADFVQKLFGALKAVDREAWVDWQDIHYSEDWWQKICTGIEAADNFVFVMTPDSVRSKPCFDEIEHALKHNKRIVTVQLQVITEEPDIQRMHPAIRQYHWMPFLDETAFDQALAELLKTIDQEPEHVKTHTRLLVRAKDWKATGEKPSLLLRGDDLTAAETWLVHGTDKPPLPTDLHSEFIASSRREEDQIQRQTRNLRRATAIFALVGVAAVVAATIAGLAFTNRAITAENQVSTATIVQGQAVAGQQTAESREIAANQSLITVTLAQGQAEARAGEANTQVANAVTAVENANNQLATATQALITATHVAQQAAEAQATLGAVSTQVAIVEQIVDSFADTMIQQRNNPAAQVAAADALVELYPDQPSARILRELIYSDANISSGTIADFDEALLRNPNDVTAYFNRGNAKADLGDLEGAIADYNSALGLNPDYADAYYNRGVAKRNQGDLEGAIADYTEAIRLNPNDTDAYVNRGNAKSDQGDLDGAIADYDAALRLNPGDATAYYNRGRTKSNQGDLDGAIADYTEAIRLDSNYVNAYYNRGSAKRNQGDLDGAIADYDEAIRLNPDFALAYNQRGIAKHDQGDLDGAIADYTEALLVNPNYYEAYYNRAFARTLHNDLEGAIADYGSALGINPDDVDSYFNRGNIKYDQGDLEGAIADYSAALHLNPSFANAYFNRGLAYNLRVAREESDTPQADFQQALSDFREAQQLGYPLPQSILDAIAQIESSLTPMPRP